MNPSTIAIAAVLLFGAGLGVGWTANGWRLHADISAIEAKQAGDLAASTTAAMTDLKTAAAAINTAANEYAGVAGRLDVKLDQIKKDMKNAKPLPVDCRPDAVRVRDLGAAIDAANEAATGHETGGTLPGADQAGSR